MGSPPEAGQQRPDPAMTPPGSFSEDASHIQRQLQQAAQHAALQQQQSIYSHQGGVPAVVESGDMDMDMASDDTLGPAQMPFAEQGRAQGQGQDHGQDHGHHHHHLAPGPSQPDQDTVVANRMPTPIQPSFAVQVRGNNWGGAAGNVMHNSMAPSAAIQETVEEGDMHASYGDRSVPRSLDHPAAMGEWSMVQNRSLPSPISESGGEEAGSPDMVLDSMALHENSFDQSAASGDSPGHEHLHRCEHDTELDTTPTPLSAMRSSPAPMATSSPIRGAMDSDLGATPSPRKGHSRSRHTVVAWTQQPGMKKSFSIGYRADCEKCRNRVPGHFNHIIVS